MPGKLFYQLHLLIYVRAISISKGKILGTHKVQGFAVWKEPYSRVNIVQPSRYPTEVLVVPVCRCTAYLVQSGAAKRRPNVRSVNRSPEAVAESLRKGFERRERSETCRPHDIPHSWLCRWKDEVEKGPKEASENPKIKSRATEFNPTALFPPSCSASYVVGLFRTQERQACRAARRVNLVYVCW
jgi:hypothetical protein